MEKNLTKEKHVENKKLYALVAKIELDEDEEKDIIDHLKVCPGCASKTTTIMLIEQQRQKIMKIKDFGSCPKPSSIFQAVHGIGSKRDAQKIHMHSIGCRTCFELIKEFQKPDYLLNRIRERISQLVATTIILTAAVGQDVREGIRDEEEAHAKHNFEVWIEPNITLYCDLHNDKFVARKMYLGDNKDSEKMKIVKLFVDEKEVVGYFDYNETWVFEDDVFSSFFKSGAIPIIGIYEEDIETIVLKCSTG